MASKLMSPQTIKVADISHDAGPNEYFTYEASVGNKIHVNSSEI